MKYVLLGSAIAATVSWVGLLQTELIPATAWAQYPIVILFCGAFVILARYYLQEQERWRQMHKELIQALRDERQEAQKALHQGLADERQALLQLLDKMQGANKENFSVFSEMQSRAFEEALEKISSQYYQLERDLAIRKEGR